MLYNSKTTIVEKYVKVFDVFKISLYTLELW